MPTTHFVPYRSKRSRAGERAVLVERTAPRALRERQSAQTTGAPQGLDLRPATPADLKWIMTYAMSLQVPAPRSGKTSWRIFLKDGERVGYMATRDETFNGERVRWICSFFIIPAYQRQHLAPQFLAIASQRYLQKGKVGCRVATDNVRVIRLLSDAGFKKVRQTNKWVDLFFDLPSVFVPSR